MSLPMFTILMSIYFVIDLAAGSAMTMKMFFLNVLIATLISIFYAQTAKMIRRR